MGGPYWKNILSRSQKRPEAEGRGTFLRPRDVFVEVSKTAEAEGRGTFLRPRQNIFPVRTDLNGKITFLFLSA